MNNLVSGRSIHYIEYIETMTKGTNMKTLHADNRSLTEVDIKHNADLSYHPNDYGFDPCQLFANACANHSETLCGVLVDALLSVDNASKGDVDAVVTIIKALLRE